MDGRITADVGNAKVGWMNVCFVYDAVHLVFRRPEILTANCLCIKNGAACGRCAHKQRFVDSVRDVYAPLWESRAMCVCIFWSAAGLGE